MPKAKTEYTPGPWRPRPETDLTCAQVFRDGRADGGEALLADVYGGSYAARSANARLMAAAPDLLDALQALLRPTPTPAQVANAVAEGHRAVARALGLA